MSARGGLELDVLPVGEAGLLLEVSDLESVLALDAAIRPVAASRQGPWRAVTDVVPAARTVLLLTETGADLEALTTAVRTLSDSVRVERGLGAASAAETAPDLARGRDRRAVRRAGPG